MIIRCAALINGCLHIPTIPATYLLSSGGKLQRISTANNLREEVSREHPDQSLLHWLNFADPKLAQYLRGNYRLNRRIFDVMDSLPATITHYYGLRIKIEQRDLAETTGNELLQKCDRILRYRAIIYSVCPSEQNKAQFNQERSNLSKLINQLHNKRTQKVSTRIKSIV